MYAQAEFIAYLKNQWFTGNFFRWAAAHAPLHPMSNNGVEAHNRDLDLTVTRPQGVGRLRVGEMVRNLFDFLRRKSCLIDPLNPGYKADYAFQRRPIICAKLYGEAESVLKNPNWVVAGPFLDGDKEVWILYSIHSTGMSRLSKGALVQLFQRHQAQQYSDFGCLVNELSFLHFLAMSSTLSTYTCTCRTFAGAHACKHAIALSIKEGIAIGYERPIASKKTRGRPAKANTCNDLFPRKRKLDTSFITDTSITEEVIDNAAVRKINSQLRHRSSQREVLDL